MFNPYLSGLRFWIWISVACLVGFVGVFCLGDPLGLTGVRHPAQPLLFFLAAVTGLGFLLSGTVALGVGLMASNWRPPHEPGTGLTP